MKIGFNEATSRDCSTLEQDLVLCEKQGFDFIEIRYDKLNEYLKKGSLRDLAEFFRTSHLKPHAFNALYLYEDMFSQQDDPERLAPLMEDFMLACDFADKMGGGSLIVVPPMRNDKYCMPYMGTWEKTKSDCLRILRRLSDMAAPHNLKLCFELVGAPKCSVRSVAQANEIVSAVDRSNVGFVFDTANIYMNGKCTDYSAIKTVDPEKIFAAHINDFDDVDEADFDVSKRCFCGLGVANVPGFLQALQDSGYEGMVSIEVFRPEYWALTPAEVVFQAHETTKKIMLECDCLQ